LNLKVPRSDGSGGARKRFEFGRHSRLEDLVKRIARTEKIDESKEFAQDVQDSLSRSVQRSNRQIKNRGVRKRLSSF